MTSNINSISKSILWSANEISVIFLHTGWVHSKMEASSWLGRLQGESFKLATSTQWWNFQAGWVHSKMVVSSWLGTLQDKSFKLAMYTPRWKLQGGWVQYKKGISSWLGTLQDGSLNLAGTLQVGRRQIMRRKPSVQKYLVSFWNFRLSQYYLLIISMKVCANKKQTKKPTT